MFMTADVFVNDRSEYFNVPAPVIAFVFVLLTVQLDMVTDVPVPTDIADADVELKELP